MACWSPARESPRFRRSKATGPPRGAICIRNGRVAATERLPHCRAPSSWARHRGSPRDRLHRVGRIGPRPGSSARRLVGTGGTAVPLMTMDCCLRLAWHPKAAKTTRRCLAEPTGQWRKPRLQRWSGGRYHAGLTGSSPIFYNTLAFRLGLRKPRDGLVEADAACGRDGNGQAAGPGGEV